MKAQQLLEFHSKPYRKITLSLQKEGLELLKFVDSAVHSSLTGIRQERGA